jgi:hypothetical protein
MIDSPPVFLHRVRLIMCVEVCAARVHCHGFYIVRVVLGGTEEPDLRPGETWARAFL